MCSSRASNRNRLHVRQPPVSRAIEEKDDRNQPRLVRGLQVEFIDAFEMVRCVIKLVSRLLRRMKMMFAGHEVRPD